MSNQKSIKIAADIETIKAEYAAGASIRAIAAKYGCSFQNINARLWNAGIVARPAGSQRILKDRVCPTCGSVFRPNSRDQRFCCLEHIRLKATCVRGHALTEDNRYHFPGGASRCRQCQHIRNADYRARKKAAV